MIKKVSIIVVNWNCGELTGIAIEPYCNYESDQVSCKVVVVDNASSDNSLSILNQYPVRLIANQANMGFGYACNQAFGNSDADYILLLNPDTQSTPATLEELVNFLENNPTYAVAGPKQLNEDGEVIRCCGRFPRIRTALYELFGLSKLFPKYFTPAPLMTDWDHLESREVDHIMGSYMLIKKNVIDRTGFMDKDYFVYWEDIDLSKRIWNAGFKSYYTCQSVISHRGGASGESAVAMRLFYSIAGRRVFWKKHLGTRAAMILTVLSITIEPPLRLLNALIRNNAGDLTHITSAYSMYIRNIRR